MHRLIKTLGTLSWRNRQDMYIMFISTFIAAGITFVAQLVMGLILAPADFGYIRIINGYFFLASTFIILGINLVLTKLCIHAPTQNRAAVYWQKIITPWLPYALFATAVIIVLTLNNLVIQSSHLRIPFIVLAVALPLYTLNELYQYLWKNSGHRKLASAGLIISKIGFLWGGIVGIIIVPTPLGFALGTVAGAALCLSILAIINRRVYPPPTVENTLTPPERKSAQYYFFSCMVVNILAMLQMQSEVLVIDNFNYAPTTVGLYFFAFMIAGTALLAQAPLAAYLLPNLAKFYDTQKKGFVKHVFKTQALVTGFIGCGCIALLIVAPFVINTFFAPTYGGALTWIPLCLIKIVVVSTHSILAQGLFIQHKMRAYILCICINLGAFAIGIYIMEPQYSLLDVIYAKIGADIITTLAYTLSNMNINTNKKTSA